MILVARVRCLDLRAHALVRHGASFSDERLLRLMTRWLAAHEAIPALLPGMPEPPHSLDTNVVVFAKGLDE